MDSFLDAPPTAELEPITHDYVQSDEVDMGMTYQELSLFGTLRQVMRCGPVSMYTLLIKSWGATISPLAVLEKLNLTRDRLLKKCADSFTFTGSIATRPQCCRRLITCLLIHPMTIDLILDPFSIPIGSGKCVIWSAFLKRISRN